MQGVGLFLCCAKGNQTARGILFFRLILQKRKDLFLLWIKVDRLIGRFLDLFYFINWHRQIVLQIRLIYIQARLQATRDAALCGKQIAIPLSQRITLRCPPLPANFLKRELPGNFKKTVRLKSLSFVLNLALYFIG